MSAAPPDGYGWKRSDKQPSNPTIPPPPPPSNHNTTLPRHQSHHHHPPHTTIQAFFEGKLPGALTFPDIPDAPSIYVAITSWLCGSITTYSTLNSGTGGRSVNAMHPLPCGESCSSMHVDPPLSTSRVKHQSRHQFTHSPHPTTHSVAFRPLDRDRQPTYSTPTYKRTSHPPRLEH